MTKDTQIERVADMVQADCTVLVHEHDDGSETMKTLGRDVALAAAKAAIDAMQPELALMDEMAEALQQLIDDIGIEAWEDLRCYVQDDANKALTKYRKAKGE